MMEADALRAITRRALRIDYVSPLVCLNEVIISASGSGDISTLNILPTLQAAGPASLTALDLGGGQVQLNWSPVAGAFAYVVERADSEFGVYQIQISGTVSFSFVDSPGAGTWFYRVFAIEPNFGLTESSPLASITV